MTDQSATAVKPADNAASVASANTDDAAPKPDVVDDFVTTHHKMTTIDGELKYTTTTGKLVIYQDVVTDDKFEGRKPKAEVFITAYTVDGGDAARPLAFAFNGGPGSSSVWLHMGLLGPRRVDAGDAGSLARPPYGVLDNPETLLRVADLVFIDPVSTGLSRAVPGESAKQFHGWTGDIESVAEVIRLWTTRNGRWLAPKFVIGESYGGTRAAGLADYLQQRYGMFLNGVVLIAPALNTQTLYADKNSDLPYPLFLPSYAAAAHYHGKIPGKTLDEAVGDALDYVDEYRNVLARGRALDPVARAAAVAKVAALTGLSPEYVDLADLRVSHMHYLAELLRDRRQVVGRLDARFAGPTDAPLAETMSHDPFNSATEGSFTAAWNHYLYDELNYHNDDVYETTTTNVRPWSYKEFEGSAVDVADKLAAAMVDNPFLEVFLALGRYDAGVPAEAVIYSMDQMAIPYADRSRIETKIYPAGHMMYLHEQTRVDELADLAAFIKRAS